MAPTQTRTYVLSHKIDRVCAYRRHANTAQWRLLQQRIDNKTFNVKHGSKFIRPVCFDGRAQRICNSAGRSLSDHVMPLRIMRNAKKPRHESSCLVLAVASGTKGTGNRMRAERICQCTTGKRGEREGEEGEIRASAVQRWGIARCGSGVLEIQ